MFVGLGKTVQVISFLALQKERGNIGPHLIVVPYVVSLLMLLCLIMGSKVINSGKLVS